MLCTFTKYQDGRLAAVGLGRLSTSPLSSPVSVGYYEGNPPGLEAGIERRDCCSGLRTQRFHDCTMCMCWNAAPKSPARGWTYGLLEPRAVAFQAPEYLPCALFCIASGVYRSLTRYFRSGPGNFGCL